MNKKILSILLAVLMVAGLCFALIQVSANEDTTAYVYYVGGTGASDSNNGLSAQAPFATLKKAIVAAENADVKKGDTVTVKVSGAVNEGSGGAQYILSSFSSGSASSVKKPADAILVPVLIEGATEDAAINIATATSGTATSSTRRYAGAHNLVFKDLKFTVSGNLTQMMYLSAGTGNLTFDNVTFDTSAGTKWRLYADAMVGGAWKGYSEANDATAENKATINSSITFKNGDYTNLDEVAAIASCATGSSTTAYVDKVPGAYNPDTWTSYPCVINTKVVIGEGAKMDTVHGINWHSFAATGTVDVKDGATVAKLIAVGDDCDIASENAITINVEGGAEINSYVEREGTNVFEGTVAYHSYDNGCDATCNEAGCDETRTANDHAYTNACDKDCNNCGEVREVPGHVYDNMEDTVCNVCGGKRYVYYVVEGFKDSASGVYKSSGSGFAKKVIAQPNLNQETNYMGTVKYAVGAAYNKNGVEGGAYQPGDTVEIVVAGSCWGEASSTSGDFTSYSGYSKNLLASGAWVLEDTAGNHVPIIIRGATAADGITKNGQPVADGEDSVWFYGKQSTSGTHQASSRKWTALSFEFKDLRLGVKNANKTQPVNNGGTWTYTDAAAPLYVQVSATYAPLKFDNVIFDDSGFTELPEGCPALDSYGKHNGWCIDAGMLDTSGSIGSSTFTWANGKNVKTGISFYNGNYENVKIAAVGSQFGVTTVANYRSVTQGYTQKPASITSTMIIGKGAEMGTIYGVGQTTECTNVNVIIQDGAQVEAFYGTIDRTAANQTTLFGKLNITVNGGQIGTFSGTGAFGRLVNGQITVREGKVLNVVGGLNIIVNGGQIGTLFGSSNANGCVEGPIYLEINGGTFGAVQPIGTTASSTYKPSVNVKITDGIFNGAVCNRRNSSVYAVSDMTMTITGGTFNKKVVPMPLSTVNGDLNLTITGGTFKELVALTECATVKGDMNLVIGREVTPQKPLPAQSMWPSFAKHVGICAYNDQNSSNANANTTTASSIAGDVNVTVHYGTINEGLYIGTNVYMVETTSSMANANMTINGGTFNGVVSGAYQANIAGGFTFNVNGGTFNNSVYGLRKSTVAGDAAITVDGNAHFTHKNSAYLLSGDSTAANVTFTVGREVTEQNPLPAENARPVFDGIVRGGDGCTVTGTLQSTFHYGNFKADVNCGTNGTVGDIVATVNGGTFGGFATNRAGSTESVTVTVNGGTFDKVFSGTGQDGSANGVVTITYNGGTFNDRVRSYAAGTATSVTSYVYGGTFNSRFYGGSDTTPWGGESGNDVVVKMFLQPKNDITFKSIDGEPAGGQQIGEMPIEASGGAGKLRLYAGANTIYIDTFTGSQKLNIEEAEKLNGGKAYVIITGNYADKLNLTSAVGDNSKPFVMEDALIREDEDPVDCTFVFPPLRAAGAGFFLNESISTRLYFNQVAGGNYGYILNKLTMSLTVNGVTKTVRFGDLGGKSDYISGSIYNYLEIPSMKASDFHKTITFSGMGVQKTFSIAQVAKEGAQLYAESNPEFAKTAAAIYNYALAACKNDTAHNGCSFRNETYLEGADANLNKVTGEVKIQRNGWLDVNPSDANAYTMYIDSVGRSLSLSDTMAMKYYVYAKKGGAGSQTGFTVKAEDFKLKINGVEIPNNYYKVEETSIAGTNYNYTFTLYFNASYLTNKYTLEIYYDQSGRLAVITDSVALICKQYVEAYGSNSTGVAAEKALAYAQATQAYGAKYGTTAILNKRREIAYNAMLESMGGFLWSPSETITYYVIGRGDQIEIPDIDVGLGTYDDPDSYVNKITLYKDRIYSGIPYTHGGGGLEGFMNVGTQQKNGVWTLDLTSEMLTGRSSGQTSRFGNDCSDAVLWAWATISTNVSFGGPAGMTDAHGVVKVGNYKSEAASSFTDTHALVKENGESVMYQAYSLLQRADALIHKPTTSSGHVLMVDHLEIVYNADGSINPTQSKVHCLEQSRKWLVHHNEGEHYDAESKYWDENLKTWVYKAGVPELEVTFAYLYKNGYVPVTCRELVDPTIGGEKGSFTDSVKNRNLDNLFSGKITTNYLPAYLTLTVEDGSGKVIQDVTIYSQEGEKRSFNLARIPTDIENNVTHTRVSAFDPDALAAGKYTIRGVMRIANGEDLEVINFEYEKEKVAVLILMGQSNACGWVEMPEGSSDRITTPLQNVYGLSRTQHQNLGAEDGLTWSGYVGAGMNLSQQKDHTYSLANCLAKQWQAEIDSGADLPDLYVVQIAVGAQGVTGDYQWNPEYSGSKLALYPFAVSILSKLEESFESRGQVADYVGIHWLGGENDFTVAPETLKANSMLKNTYNTLFKGFYDAIGKEVPTVLYQLNCYHRTLDFLDSNPGATDSMNYINTVFNQLCSEYDQMTVFDSKNSEEYDASVVGYGLFASDKVHYRPEVMKWMASCVLEEYQAR